MKKMMIGLLLVAGIAQSCFIRINDKLLQASVNSSEDLPEVDWVKADTLPAGVRRIDVMGSYDVVFKQADDARFELSGTGNLQSCLCTVEGDRLVIRSANQRRMVQPFSGDITVTVSMPGLESISLAGSGAFTAASLDVENLDVSLAGSGDISLSRLQVENLSVSLAGSGDVKLKGNASWASLSLAGSGDIDARELDCPEIETRKSGSGDISLPKGD